MENFTGPSNSAFERWLERDIPELLVNQLEKFKDKESIDVQEIGEFLPTAHADKLKHKVGNKVLGIDAGGGSVRGGVYQVDDDGGLILTEDFTESTAAENGEGFLAQLERFAKYAKDNTLPVGISYGGPLDGSKPRFHPKITILMDQLSEKYGGDFANIFDTPTVVLNDGPAGLVRSTDMVYRKGIENPVVFYLINGGGLGLAVYKDGKLYSTEAGHVEVVDDLNRNGADRPCGIYGDYVCLENVISNKQGLERQWVATTGNNLNGKEIEDKFKSNDPLAEILFEQVALTQAIIIKGVAKIFDLDVNSPNFAPVVHGGMQRTPNLKKRTAQILWQEKSPNRAIDFTEEFDQNACMHGAALMAVTL